MLRLAVMVFYKGYYVDRVQGDIIYDDGLVRLENTRLSIGKVMQRLMVNM